MQWPPAFMLLTGWLKFPAIGWELALDLPDLAKREWLYWVFISCGILFPVTLVLIIMLDDGKVSSGDPLTLPCTQGGALDLPRHDGDRTDAEEEDDVSHNEEKYMAYRKKRVCRMIVLPSFLLSVVLIVVGVTSRTSGGSSPTNNSSSNNTSDSDDSSDGQVFGLGLLLLAFSVMSWLLEKGKLWVLESQLKDYDRVLAPSYRAMRNFICSSGMLARTAALNNDIAACSDASSCAQCS